MQLILISHPIDCTNILISIYEFEKFFIKIISKYNRIISNPFTSISKIKLSKFFNT